jgi:hypothetical protein
MAMEACLGSRPVAKALGAESSMTYTFGMGTLAAIVISRTMFISWGALVSSTSLAPDAARTSLSPAK